MHRKFISYIHEGKLVMTMEMGEFIKTYPRKEIQVILGQPTKPRSNDQNQYMWAVPLKMIADETGEEAEYWHEFFKQKFLCIGEKMINGQLIKLTKSTTELSTVEMEDYLARMRTWAAINLGMNIPEPNQVAWQ